MTASPQLIHGRVAPGFEEVRNEFKRNFSERGELGAACTVYYRGEKVVDLWGGFRDEKTKALWEENTLVPVMSTTKGIASMAVAHAHSNGLIDHDALVVDYWPEFGQNGKEEVTVRQLLSHQAGLCAIDEPLDLEIMGDPEKMAEALAKQKPAWEPGAKHGYHSFSLGCLEGELIRRVDPQKRTVGRYFHEEIAVPLQLDFYIGIPSNLPRTRIATIKGFRPWQALFNLNKMPWPFVKGLFNPRSITARTFANPAIIREFESYNNPRFQAIELPAANGIGEVRSIAKAYSEFATGGKTLGLHAGALNALQQPATPPRDGLLDQVFGINTVYSLGYLKPIPDYPFCSSDKAFGTPGAGGSFGFADPDLQVGFAYAPNKSGFYLWNDPREQSLREATYRCLKKS
jgi:CubicO group peptidase (beta-lactamase class C family)